MDEDGTFLTATMARVFSDQGLHGKAVQVYRHLLSQDPGRPDLAASLAAAEAAHQRSGHDRLVALFTQWFDLAAGWRRIERLQRLRRNRRQGVG
jgi:hypothetical protein